MRNIYTIVTSAKFWLILFIVSLSSLFVLFSLFFSYVSADINLLKAWHPRFYPFIFYIVKITLGAPFITFLGLVISSYPILKSKKTELLLLGCSLFVGLIIAEITLRSIGYRPGYTGKYPFFTAVDSLYELKDYEWDNHGIVHFSDTIRDQINQIVDVAQTIQDNNELSKYIDYNDNFDYCGWLLMHDFGELYTTDNNSEFKKYINHLKQQSTLDDADSAVLEYSKNPINKEGFKSLAFKQYKSKKKKIFLIGDSFTYGMSASPVYNCYADLLLTKGFIVWNPSFPNNDPENYLQIATKYIPILKPDIVIVCFYMGNDIMRYNRKSILGKRHFFATNAGWINGEEGGCYFDNAKQAYDYYFSKATIRKNNIAGKVCSMLTISSLLYTLYNKISFDKPKAKVNNCEPTINGSTNNNLSHSYNKIKSIKNLCLQNSTEMKILLLPDLVTQNPYNANFNPKDILKELKYIDINDLTKDDYNRNPNDGHFNNKGHAKAASAIVHHLQ